MIIECPSCQARYVVPIGAFAAGGRKVRCARCRNEWVAALPTRIDVFAPAPAPQIRSEPAEAARAPIPPPIPEEARQEPAQVSGKLPALIKKFSLSAVFKHIDFKTLLAELTTAVNWKKVILRAIICVILAVLFVVWPIMDRDNIVKAMPALRDLYESWGFYIAHSGQGLVFNEVKSELKYDAGTMRLYINGVIHNNTNETQLVPDIKARAIGPDQHIIQSWWVPAPAATVGARSDLPFHTEIATPMRHTIDNVYLESYAKDEKGDVAE